MLDMREVPAQSGTSCFSGAQLRYLLPADKNMTEVMRAVSK